jgi:nanoRNase/pAp phosphatase (c-di-AMP/oligoRNAs hydrolase)
MCGASLICLAIANGGGHEGAIGFRLEREEIRDIEAFMDRQLDAIDEDVQKRR